MVVSGHKAEGLNSAALLLLLCRLPTNLTGRYLCLDE